ncbi:toll/interleukin-1 receptor domain-containing protein [Amycolatopsis sp. FBCC-B4732]|uniref:toll/interleukin-1 receptor domain-containing protein n=1 Tax=Amycolatopsis sp. FBCC-B4732 TaxID=3079339 RepID=UPI001FF33F1B|nr:toll/interleukin-1 receptor domain-containing protein [Amycolatopsis sp. FBCC-B4732]UOX90408.1 toll/interleukin-1 receptor domain-containing protein [Amycolatopsis sp. FBCC-B4732]
MSHQNDQEVSSWLQPLSSDARQVFISHAAEDVEIAFKVAALLKRYLDINAYVDQSFLRVGSKWRPDIEGKIKSSEVVIVLRSRVVAAEASPGVINEVEYARQMNIPVVFGAIRGAKLSDVHHEIDFGEDGSRVGAVWDLAKFLLSESHPYRALGLGSVCVGTASVSATLGDPEIIASREGMITVLGHTMKQWLGNYGNAIRHARSKIRMYFPATDAIGMDLLIASHRNEHLVLSEIEKSKAAALELQVEIDDPEKFAAYLVPVKPMFSATIVEPSGAEAVIVVDPYSFKVGAELRPKFIVRGKHTDLFSYYHKVVSNIIAKSEPLRL